jgi:hypothetical protein
MLIVTAGLDPAVHRRFQRATSERLRFSMDAGSSPAMTMAMTIQSKKEHQHEAHNDQGHPDSELDPIEPRDFAHQIAFVGS